MKTYSTQALSLLLLIAIAVFAGITSAGNPATRNTSTFPANNTPLPVHTQASQIKGSGTLGGLSVGNFVASGAAEFDGMVGIQGILYGKASGSNNTLSFGSTSPNRKVTLGTTGDTYVTGGGLYAQDLRNTENKQLCATQAGVIVFCTRSVVVVPPPPAAEDLCENVAGIQTSLNQDLTIEDPTRPKFCTQTIRATLYAWQHGNYASLRNNSNSYATSLFIKNIDIKSIGGNTQRNTWPSDAIALRFRWGYCSGWGPGPRNNFNPQDYQGSIANGICNFFSPDYKYLSTLPYGVYKYGRTADYDIYYTLGFDGVRNRPAGNVPSEGYQLFWPGDPKGTFSAYYYTQNNGRLPTGSILNWNQAQALAPNQTLAVSVKPGPRPRELYDMDWIMSHLGIKLPLDRLIVDDVKVPYGYKLVLSNDEVKSPGTRLDVHPVKNSAYVAKPNPTGVTRVNVYIGGGFGADLDLGGIKWTDNMPNGTYQVSVSCSSGRGTAIPSSFTLPKDWGVGIEASCQ